MHVVRGMSVLCALVSCEVFSKAVATHLVEYDASKALFDDVRHVSHQCFVFVQ